MTRKFVIFAGTFVLVVMRAGMCWGWEGVVTRIIDGDSIQVEKKGKTYEIRLYGIDAPEYRQPFSNRAKQFAKRSFLGKSVTVKEKDVDRYGRLVAVVSNGEKLMNRELVREGLAWFYPRYCLEQPLCGELKQLEMRARNEKLGLWSDAEPVPPWEWKRGKVKDGPGRKGSWFQRFINWL